LVSTLKRTFAALVSLASSVDVCELGDPVPLDDLLLRVARQLREAAVERLDLHQGQVGHAVAHVREFGITGCCRRCVDALVGLDGVVVPDHYLAVLCQVRVQFKGGHAQREGVRERGQGLLGPLAAAATVALQVKGAVALVRFEGRGSGSGSVR
jgi:hypothetical protein